MIVGSYCGRAIKTEGKIVLAKVVERCRQKKLQKNAEKQKANQLKCAKEVGNGVK